MEVPCPACRALWWSRRFYMNAKVAGLGSCLAFVAFYGFSVARMWATDAGDPRASAFMLLANLMPSAVSVLFVASVLLATVGWIIGRDARRPGPVAEHVTIPYRQGAPHAVCPAHPRRHDPSPASSVGLKKSHHSSHHRRRNGVQPAEAPRST